MGSVSWALEEAQDRVDGTTGASANSEPGIQQTAQDGWSGLTESRLSEVLQKERAWEEKLGINCRKLSSIFHEMDFMLWVMAVGLSTFEQRRYVTAGEGRSLYRLKLRL